MDRNRRSDGKISLTEQEAYWHKNFDDLPSLEFPLDYPRPPVQSYIRNKDAVKLDKKLFLELKRFCLQENITLFTTLLAAFKIILMRYTGYEDIIVGSVSSDGGQEEGNTIEKRSANPVGLRTNLAGDLTAKETLVQVKKTIDDAAKHRDYSFEKIVKQVSGDEDLTRAPIFQVMFILRDVPFCISETPISENDLADIEEDTAMRDVVMIASEEQESLNIECEYDADLFEPATIKRILEHFQILLPSLISNPDQKISALPLLTEEQRHQLLVEWNNTQRDYPRDACLHQLFEAQVDRSPNAVALLYENEKVTYRELNSRANQLANHLQKLGVGPDVFVGIYMTRSIEMLVSLYGTLKAGGAYVPLDPEYPPERLAFMLEEAQMPVLLTQDELVKSLPNHNAQVVCLNSDWSTIAKESTDNLNSGTTAENLAYVIYTSGSTGRPKGVMNAHLGICNRLLWMQDTYQLTDADCVLQKTPFSFDVSVWEFFWPLLVGARLAIAQPGGHKDNSYLVNLIAEKKITTLHFVPSMLQVFLEEKDLKKCQCLKRVICSGEAMPFDLQERFFARMSAELHNLYGPTEAAVDVTYWACQRHGKHNIVPIGKPVANTQIYLLDPQLQPVPVGVLGELHIGGVQVAKGYVNRPELTEEKFIHDPFSKEKNSRLYKTGDLARYLSDGSIEFVGRIDNQVKIRGFRIELGEIETVLFQHPDVREAVIILREDNPDDKRLVAYIVPNQKSIPTISELHRYLREKLPEYMVPAAFVILDVMPLTSNGKVDRRALPLPETHRPELETTYVVPQNEAEQLITSTWQEVLQVEQVGIHDNFFDLGGHSLLLVRVREKLQEIFGQELSTTELFQYPTVESLAKYLTQKSKKQSSSQSNDKKVSIHNAEKVSSTSDSAIAIIGMDCRFPGAKNIDEFWDNLHDGVESVSFFSDEELISLGTDPALLNEPNYVKASAVLADIDLFDASFFGFSRKEAEMIDPQQRLFLESAWNAVESAGYNVESHDMPIGVYAGVGMNSYLLNHLSPNSNHPAGGVGAFQLMIGNDKDFLPTRVSYKLNLKGPSINIQTACSTSLVAVHMACKGLRDGECHMALAGGVSIHLPQKMGYLYQEGMILSPDGHCRAFDAKAQGTVFGSGVGIVVLKRLEDAVADGDCIHAIIKGSAINNDGSLKVGYTAPSVDGQALVISQAQAEAKIDAETVTYIEAHGTGTPLGDPIEIAALTQAFRANTQEKGFCAIGSLKTNIGHVDAAAGVGGLIKAILALKHRLIPPSLHFEKPNPQIDFANSPFYVNTELSEWKTNGTPRRAGVSSFGIGGTNCHIIVEEAPETSLTTNNFERSGHILSLSAKNEEALYELTQHYCSYLSSNSQTALPDICFTANAGRVHFDCRLAVVAESTAHLQKQLSAFISQETPAGLIHGKIESDKGQKIAFLFTGQGAQYVGMGRELYNTQPVFRETLERCDAILRSYLEHPLLEVLYPEPKMDSPLDETAYTQPALFSLEYALAQLWQSWGITPDVVMGHSVGEYVAACFAGVFNLEDGLKLIAERGRLMQALPQDGDMVSVMADEARILAALEPFTREVSIAALNGPRSVVISGKRQAIQEVTKALEAEGVKTKKLSVSHAFHSPLMEPMLEAFKKVASEVKFSSPTINLISNIAGELATKEVETAEYWCRHVRQPVKFEAGMETLHKQGYKVFVEIGPQPTLLGMGRQCLPSDEGVWLPSLRQKQSDWQQILQSLGILHVKGTPVDWLGFDRHYCRRRVVLPTYPFQRQSYWVEEAAVGKNQRLDSYHEENLPSRPIIGQQLRLPLSQEIRFESYFSRYSPPYNNDHRVFGVLVVPGVSHMAMFLIGVQEAFGLDSFIMEELFFLQPFVLSEEGGRMAQLIFEPVENDIWSFKLVSLKEEANANDPGAWTIHATGKINLASKNRDLPAAEKFDLAAIESRCKEVIKGPDFYKNFWVQGEDAGPSFRWIKTIWQKDGEALGQTEFPELLSEDVSDYLLYPGLIEACLQVMRCCREFESAPLLAKGGDIYVPFSIESFKFYGHPHSNQLWCYASIPEEVGPESKSVIGDLHLLDENGKVIAAIIGFEVRRINRENLLRNLQKDPNDWLYRIAWQPKVDENNDSPLVPEKTGSWLIFADREGIGSNLSSLLKQKNEQCILVFPNDTYKIEENERYHINPRESQDFHRLFEDIKKRQDMSGADNSLSIRGVIYLWSLEGKSEQEINLSSLQNTQILGCAGALHLVQALAKIGWSEFPRLWLITRGTQALGAAPSPVEIHQAPLWGLARVVMMEHPELQCVRLDLAPSKETEEVGMIFKELWSSSSEDQIAYREGVRHVARLIRHTAKSPTSQDRITVNGDGSYLITGGLGGLGLKVADWLITQGARNIVLTGRSGATETSQNAIKQLENEGAKVLVVRADVSRSEDVTKLFETISSSMPPLRGIIHAAGVLDDGILLKQNWESFCKVMAPKMEGTWNLHVQTQEMLLDFFVCFSSATSLLGAPGQGNYAAANAFLDAFAHYRQSHALPCLSINWGPWGEVGMAAELDGRDRRRQEDQGWSQISLDQGLQIIGTLLGQTEPQVGALPINWSKYVEQFPTGDIPPVFSELTRSSMSKAKAAQQSATQQHKFLQSLLEAPADDRQDLLATYIENEVASLLGLEQGGQSIDHRQGFAEMGMDSLMGIELRSRLQKGLEISLSSTFALDYSNIEDITAFLSERLSLAVPTEPEPKPAKKIEAQSQILEEAKGLSGSELEMSIEEELAKLETSLTKE